MFIIPRTKLGPKKTPLFRSSLSSVATVRSELDMSQAPEPTSLPSGPATIKHQLIEGREESIVSSWQRLLTELKAEVDYIQRTGPETIPSISFGGLNHEDQLQSFATDLQKRGTGIVRGVVSEDVVQRWVNETQQYVSHNSSSAGQNQDIFWSPAQTRARAHPNVLHTQRMFMNLWHTTDSDPLTPNFPVMYADRLHLPTSESAKGEPEHTAHMSGGSVERWESDARASAYQEIWEGRWEDYDPWVSRKQFQDTSNIHNNTNTSSAAQMGQGLFCLRTQDTRTGPLRICPMLRLSTAYILLRPFFTPRNTCPEHSDYLSPENWIFQRSPSSTLHGAAPTQRQTVSDILHPHLQIPSTLVSTPTLQPGDYLLLHPDTITAPQIPHTSIILSLPICPLTRPNALYLLRQRKAFLLGQPPPDFQQLSPQQEDDSRWVGRLGVQEVSDTGGEEALRAMGLAPWDEDDVEGVMEAEVVEEANNVLFPDRYDFDMGGV